MSVENPGGKRYWRGGYVCECVTLIYPIMEQRMIDAGVMSECFDIFQYCYNAGGVSASAGTHDGGGTTDSAQDSTTQLRIQRECGAAAWGRTPAEGFDYHCHSVLIGCPHLSSGAADQVNDYRNGRNGLANNGPDTGPDVPYITWQDAYAKYAGTTGGVLGMSEVEKFDRSKDQSFTDNGDWHTVKISDDDALSLLTGPCDTYLAISGVTIGDLPEGQVAQFRYRAVSDYSDDRATVVEYSYPISEFIGSSGSTYAVITWANNLGKSPKDDAKLRLRLFVKPPQGCKITITDLDARCIHD